MQSCPSANDLRGLLDGSLSGEKGRDLDQHVSGCADCRAELDRLESIIRDAYSPSVDTHRAAHAAFAAAPPPLVEGYETLSLIKVGGQGIVYKARQIATKRTVAVKLLSDTFPSREQLKRFEREIQCVARLRHPHIVTVYDCRTTDDDRLYYSMEFIEGRPLNDFLRAINPSVEKRLELFIKICDAVAYAHGEGIIHRDLKPGNILVDAHGEPRVLDFGLARQTIPERTAATAHVTRSGEFVGTLAYAAPEQFEGIPGGVTALTDVWALGVILHEMLTDERPFKSTGSLAGMERQIRELSAPRPSLARPGLDDDLDTIVLRAMAKEPIRRYASAGDLAADVKRFLAGEPIEARHDSLSYIIRKRIRRNRSAIGIGLLLVTLVVAAVYYRRAAEVASGDADIQAARYLVTEARLLAGRQPDDALAMLDRAIQRDPAFVEAKIERALLLWRTRRPSEAIEAAEATLRAHPAAGDAHILLARFYESRDRSKASQHRERAAGMDLDDAYYRALFEEDDHRAIKILTEIIDEKGQTADRLIERIVRYQNVRDFDAMLRDAADLQELEPQSASAWNAIGTAHAAMENYDEALRCFDKSLQYGPDMPQTYLHRGQTFGLLGRHSDAAADCSRAVELDPGSGLAYSIRAWARFSLGDDNAALADCEQAIRLSPWDARAYWCRGMIARQRGELSAALADFTRAIDADPKTTDAFQQRAELHYFRRNYAAAVEDMTSVIRLLPTGDRHKRRTAQAYDFRARAYENLRQFDLALADFGKAVELDPSLSRSFYNRGRCHRLMGNYAAALTDHDMAVRLSNGAAADLLGRALARRYLGDDEQALHDIRLAVSGAANPQKALLRVRLWEVHALRDEADEAASALADILATPDAPPWTQLIISFLVGRASNDDLIRSATSDDARCDAFYYVGLKALVDGQRADAIAAFRNCIATGFIDLDEYDLARWHLERLEVESTSPPAKRE